MLAILAAAAGRAEEVVVAAGADRVELVAVLRADQELPVVTNPGASPTPMDRSTSTPPGAQQPQPHAVAGPEPQR
jgi:hypothetical protein